MVFHDRAINNEATPAIGMAYLAGYAIDRGHDVTIVDSVSEALNHIWPMPDFAGIACQGLTFEDAIARIPENSQVIGISIMFSGEWPVQRKFLEKIRECFPKAVIIAGGEHATALSEYVLRDCPSLDACVMGEGEHTFFEILEKVSENESIYDLNGIAYLDASGAFIRNETQPRVRDLSQIPWPHWPDGYLEKFWAAGKSFGIGTERDMPIMGSRGCPYQCTFCSNPQMWTTRYTLRDIDDLISEIKHYIDKYNITSLQFYDLTAITKKRWTVEFCKKLLEEDIKISWSLPSGTRSEALDVETLSLLKETGCTYLVYAPESGSPRILEKIKKRISLDGLTESIINAKNLGITTRANLIIGFPGETRKDMLKTIFYGFKLAMRGVEEVPINLYSAYPGSEIFKHLIKDNRVTLNDDYFLSLTSINSDFLAINPMVVNEIVSPRGLAIYRVVAMGTNYLLGYLINPSRIIRTIRNVFGDSHVAATVLEHRLKDSMRRGKT